MIDNNVLVVWNSVNNNLKKLVLPISFLLMIFYLFLCLLNIFYLVSIPILYFLITGISREIVFTSDFMTALIIGYKFTQSYLWDHVIKPPKLLTRVNMSFLFILFFTPAWECRIRRLKRNKNKVLSLAR